MTIPRRLSLTGFGLVLLSACGAPEADGPPPGPFLGGWTEVTRIGEYETPVEEVFGSIRAAALMEGGGVVYDGHELPFWPSAGCSMHGRIFILGGHEDLAVHEVGRAGEVLHSFPASDYADEAAEGALEAIAWDIRDQARGGLLTCFEASGHVIHLPQYLGWARAYTVAGDLAWHSSLPDFVERRVVPAAGGGAVKYEFDPDFGFSHSVRGAAVVGNTHLAVSISVSVPRGQEPGVEGLLALLDLGTGSQTRRDEFAGVVMVGLGKRAAVVYREPFPSVAIVARGES